MNIQKDKVFIKVNKIERELLLKLENCNVLIKNFDVKNGRMAYLNLDIKGEIPSDLCFPHLKSLFIDDDFESSSIDFIVRHKNLEKLNFSSCGLTKIPNFNGGLTKLKELSLLGNNIMKIDNLENFDSLEKLLLTRNNIKKIEGLNHLINLKTLSMVNNKIKTLEGFEQFKKLRKLKDIYLGHNLIYELCEFQPLSVLSGLQSIDLAYNQIQDLNITYDVPNLQLIRLNNNPISHITAVKNLSILSTLLMPNSNLTKLENLSNLPKLIELYAFNTPIKLVSGLEAFPYFDIIGPLDREKFTFEEFNNLEEYISKIEWELKWDEQWDDDPVYMNMCFEDSLYGYDHRFFVLRGPTPRSFFKINDFISIKLAGYHSILYLGGEKFSLCTKLLLNFSDIQKQKLIKSIDEAAEKLNPSLHVDVFARDIGLTPEQEYWGHCSNLQAWAESKYDTRLLHRTLAFPLLKRLTELGDPIAKKVFKEEIAKRYASGTFAVTTFLKKEGYLKYLSKDELSSLDS